MSAHPKSGSEPAYPTAEGLRYANPSTLAFYGERNGLTKRELFAAMAMQGMAMRVTDLFDREVAMSAVRLADALIAELEKANAPD